MTSPTPQVDAAMAVVGAMADAIRELGEVPSGHLYAGLSGMMSLGDYQAVIGWLEREKFITVENHLIRWVHPEQSPEGGTLNTGPLQPAQS